MKKQMVDNKGKQEKEVFLYKPYDIDLSRLKTLELTLIQDEIKNLEKYMKYIQLPVKMIPFYLPLHYKSI